MLGLEGDGVEARVAVVGLGMREAGFSGDDDERGLGGIALRGPAAVFLDKLGIVAKQAGAQAFDERGRVRPLSTVL